MAPVASAVDAGGGGAIAPGCPVEGRCERTSEVVREAAEAERGLGAGGSAEAVRRAFSAARALAAAGDHPAAAALFGRALPYAPGDLAPPIRLALAESLAKLGRHRDAAGVLSEQPLDALPVEHLAALAEALRLAGDVAAARSVLARYRERGGADAVEIGRQEAECALVDGDLAGAGAAVERLLRGSAATAADRLRLRLLLGRIRLAGSDDSGALVQFAEARRAAASLGDPVHEVRAGINEAICLMRIGETAQALRGFRDAAYLAAVLDLRREEAIAVENLAVIEHMRRRYGPALDHYRKALGLFDGLGNPEYVARVAHNIGELMLRLGDPVGAAEQLDHARRFILRRADAGSLFGAGAASPRRVGCEGAPPAIRGEGALLRARIALAAGRTREAAEAIDDARAVYSTLDEPERRAEVVTLEAERLLRDGDGVAAHDLVRGRTPLLARFPRHHAAALLVAADALDARGSDPRASLERVLDIARRLADDELLWRARFRLARYYLSIHRMDDARKAARAAERADRRIRESAPREYLARMDRMPDRAALRAFLRRLDGVERPGAVRASGEPPAPEPGQPLVGSSPAWREVLDRVRRVARTDAVVLLTGETGVGKDRLARAIHDASDRAGGPFVKVSCGAMVEDLLLSELLGHERGAFTGAAERRAGWFEVASGGTLYLDEIADASPRAQAVILRVLEERKVTRIGATAPVQVDVRVVCATNRSIEDRVRDGSFRADLYYMLRPMRVRVPPLRERREDVADIATAVLADVARGRAGSPRAIDRDAADYLAGREWPGNVRELENAVRAAAALASGPVLRLEDFADGVPSQGPRVTAPTLFAREVGGAVACGVDDVLAGRATLADVLDRARGAVIRRALADARGDVACAARLLGMTRPQLARTLAKLKLDFSHSDAERSDRRAVPGPDRPARTKGVR